ncbi:MAG: aminodeoxychorismate/anthranilate synthase component II [Nocardioidaceae bacterium]|nr:aminodeoxychorismate/anthranilate synthase component II [Nocardioidaceae bacterium]
MRPRVIVVDHYDSYTWNLVHLIAAVTGVLPIVVQHDQTSAAQLVRFSHIVLSPGPGHPDEPADFALGPAVFDLGVPVLGVCLGMQALVTAYGGQVGQVRPAHGEIAAVVHHGQGPFAGQPSPFTAVRYHSLAALRVPDVLVETAWCRHDIDDTGDLGDTHDSDESGRVLMGVQHREKPLWGVQFHPESILTENGGRLVANFLALS